MLFELQPIDYWNKIKFGRDVIGSNASYTYNTNGAFCTLGGPDKVILVKRIMFLLSSLYSTSMSFHLLWKNVPYQERLSSYIYIFERMDIVKNKESMGIYSIYEDFIRAT